MKIFAPIALALLLSILPSSAAETALSALQGLSKNDARSLVRITAQDGLGAPEHWYFTVYDREAPSALRLLVVAKAEVVTSQDVPAAEAAGLNKDLLDTAAIRIDSDRAATLALSYAAASQMKVSFLNYELVRQGARAVPVWIVTCLDQNQKALGSLVITASKGNIVATEGFTQQPAAAPGPQVAGIDPVVERSDREFLESQGKEAAPLAIAETPVRTQGSSASELEPWTPPSRVEALPPIVAPKGSKKTKSLPVPPRIAEERSLPDGYEFVPRDSGDSEAEDEDQTWHDREGKRHRTPPVFSSKDDLPREVRRVRSFIHRLLPF